MGEVGIVEEKPFAIDRRVVVLFQQPGPIKRTTSTDNAVNGIAFLQQMFGKVGAVLASDSSYESALIKVARRD